MSALTMSGLEHGVGRDRAPSHSLGSVDTDRPAELPRRFRSLGYHVSVFLLVLVESGVLRQAARAGRPSACSAAGGRGPALRGPVHLLDPCLARAPTSATG
jgi:hypothetical protein